MCSQICALQGVSFLEDKIQKAPQYQCYSGSFFFFYYCCSSLKVVWVLLKGSDIPCWNVGICLAFIVCTCSNSRPTAKLDIQLAAATSKLKWRELSLGILFSSPPFAGKAMLSRGGLLCHWGRIHNGSSLQVDIKATITPKPPAWRFMAKGFQQYPPPASVVIYPSPKGFKREKNLPKN